MTKQTKTNNQAEEQTKSECDVKAGAQTKTLKMDKIAPLPVKENNCRAYWEKRGFKKEDNRIAEIVRAFEKERKFQMSMFEYDLLNALSGTAELKGISKGRRLQKEEDERHTWGNEWIVIKREFFKGGYSKAMQDVLKVVDETNLFILIEDHVDLGGDLVGLSWDNVEDIFKRKLKQQVAELQELNKQ
jgi:hypothetical protein